MLEAGLAQFDAAEHHAGNVKIRPAGVLGRQSDKESEVCIHFGPSLG